MDKQAKVWHSESEHTSELQTDCDGSDDELICCEHGNPCDQYQQSDQTRKHVDMSHQSKYDEMKPDSAENMYEILPIDTDMKCVEVPSMTPPAKTGDSDDNIYGYEPIADVDDAEIIQEPINTKLKGSSAKHQMKQDSAENVYEIIPIDTDMKCVEAASTTPSRKSDDNVYGYEPIADVEDAKIIEEPINNKLKGFSVNSALKPRSIPVVDEHMMRRRDMVLDEWHKFGYIGEQSRVSAEKMCTNPISFHLYHRYPSALTTSIEFSTSDSLLKAALPLFVVYKTSQGEYRHYRVLDESKPADLFTHKAAKTWNPAYKIDIPGERTFSSLKALVDFYSTYVIIHSKSRIVDVFPWWKDSKKYIRRSPACSQRKSSDVAANSPHNSQCSCKFNCGGHFDSDSAILVTVPSTYGQPKNKKNNSGNQS
ncbi:hypothetical protein Ddc_00261 [Ditylenchus destructor]|nr:hypothetical protein Ddc_00261 [Ditylenchus destructor]